MAKQSRDLPLIEDAATRFLPWLIAFMAFLAALALIALLVFQDMVERWDRGLSGELTIQVPAPTSEDLRQGQLDRVVTVLRQTAGLSGLTVLTQEETRGLVAPWLGEGLAATDLPFPDIITVTFDPARPPDLALLGQALESAVPGTLIDDHQQWLADLFRLAGAAELAALLVLALIVASAVITVVFVTRTGLAIHRQVIELLHLMGAQDRYIATQFQWHAFWLGLRGGLAGLVLAIGVAFGLEWLGGHADFALLPRLSLQPIDWLLLLLVPLAAALIAMVTATRTVLRTLARLA